MSTIDRNAHNDLMWYNLARIHQTFRVTPAMEAGVSDHVWSLEEVAGLAE